MINKISKEDMEIIEYEDKYKKDLKRISYEWLEKYDLFEPEDKLMLNNPEEYILEKGGYIFFIRYRDEIIGTFSLIPEGKDSFELAKFAIIEKYQGNNLGKMLLQKAIEVAQKSGAKKITLFSNSKLKSAYKLYKKFGFEEIDLDESKYETADVKMELVLDN